MKSKKIDKKYCYHADFTVQLCGHENDSSEYADEFYALMQKSASTIKARYQYIGTRSKSDPDNYYKNKTQDTFRFSATDENKLNEIVDNVKIMAEDADLLDKIRYKIIWLESYVYKKDYSDNYLVW